MKSTKPNHDNEALRELEQDKVGTMSLVLWAVMLSVPFVYNMLPMEVQLSILSFFAPTKHVVSFVLHFIHFVSNNVNI